MKLYNIAAESIESIIMSMPRIGDSEDGKYEIIDQSFISDYGYPLKVVFSQESGKIVVITAYPLKRGLKK